jgi:predicted transcriptional regulator
VSGVGYQSKDGLMKILITMKMKSTDEGAVEHASDLYGMAEEFIKSDEIWSYVKVDPYTIIVRTKDKKEYIGEDGEKRFK